MSQFEAIGRIKVLTREAKQSKITISDGKFIMKDDIIFHIYEKLGSDHTKILLHETTIEEALQHVQNLKSEIAVVTVNSFQMASFKKVIELKNIKMTVLDKGPIYVHMGKDNPLSVKTDIKIKDLLKYPYLHLPPDFFSNMNIGIRVDGKGILDFKQSIIINNYHAIIQMIKRTDAFFFGNKWMIEELERGGICSKRILNDTSETSLIWLKRKKEVLSHQADAFLKCWKKYTVTNIRSTVNA